MRKFFIVLAVFGVAGCAQPEVTSGPPVVAESVYGYALLNDALRIDFERRGGLVSTYALVPATRPPGLLRMSPLGSPGEDGSYVASYQFGEQRRYARVELAPRETDTCAEINTGRWHDEATCVRDSVIAANPTGFTHVAVYFTGYVTSTPRAGDEETSEAAEFWARTEMVPIDQARWFTDLLERGAEAAATGS